MTPLPDDETQPLGLREIDFDAEPEPTAMITKPAIEKRFAFPISLDVTSRKCVVVGGDFEATDKAMRLVRAGAHVQVIAHQIEPELEAAVSRGELGWAAREVSPRDLDGAFLVIVTPEEREHAIKIAKRASDGEFLVCVIDQPELCTFASPAVATIGDLRIALSSGGKMPAVLKRFRQDLESSLNTDIVRKFLSRITALRETTPPGERSAKLREAVQGLKLSISIELPAWFRDELATSEAKEDS
ncbi:MAG: bifunctional precorrin-2 dehydrogenase/sirohydrochlorin ferrochelatase [Polyangiaceae bacterium]